MRQLRWLIVNGAMAVAVYLSLFQNNEYAINATKFFIWAMFIVSVIAMFFDDVTKAKLQAKGLPVPLWLDCLYDLVITGALASFGWFGYAAMYFFTMAVLIGIYHEDNKVTT